MNDVWAVLESHPRLHQEIWCQSLVSMGATVYMQRAPSHLAGTSCNAAAGRKSVPATRDYCSSQLVSSLGD